MYIFINNKNNFKKDLPFIILIVLYVIGFIIRNSFPYIVFETFFFTFSFLIMYFTIENPDLKILNEYIKNKELVESTIEEKSNILFKISQEVRVPLKKINLLCNNIIKNENILKIHENARNITNIANDISTIINDILDISIIDKKNIKIFESTYNIYNLFNQIVLFGNKNKNKVNFKYSISNNIPEHLYGDSSRIKQIICSILSNSFKNTEKGYVDIDIYSIIKYDICRLVITINDNRKEMSLDYINNILDNQKIVTNNEIEKFNNLNLDLKLVKKLIDLQSGSLLISSNKNSTKFTIVIDQIIDTNNNENYIKKLASQLSNKLKILLIDDDYKELELFSKELKKNNVEVISTMDAKDCMDRLLNNETFDYILIDDEMENKNAVSIINEIKKQNIKTPNVIIMLDKNKESIKEHYLEDYPFSDYLLKRIYIEEIKRIIKQKNN